MKTIIMAGGRGSRISEIFPDIPKPLIPIQNIPVLEREIVSLREQGFVDIIITVSYMADKIINHFSDGSKWGVKIKYYEEKVPLGNAGALLKLRDEVAEEPFFLLNGDAVFNVNFNRMLDFHKQHSGLVTLFTHPNSHPYDSGLLITENDNSVKKWLTKEEERPTYYKNRVNAGLHIMDPEIFHLLDLETKCRDNGNEKLDLDRDILKPLSGMGKMFCYDSPEYVKDMGTPERYYAVVNDYKKGIIEAKNLCHKQKAVFLDRDGVINKYKGFLRNIEDFELIDGVAEAIKIINDSGYLCIVVTNQPVIARGEVTFDEMDEIHKKMETLLGAHGAYVDALYYCPHHPDKGYDGEISALKISCNCRKPKPGMLLTAANDYNIDLKKSFMIGDGLNDIEAGKKAGCQTILINGNGSSCYGDNCGQDYTFDSLLDTIMNIGL